MVKNSDLNIKVYAIIVTYNAMLWIDRCLNSVNKQCGIILVDNNSSDETVSFVKRHFYDIIILPQEKNLGFGSANNLGISKALKLGADYFFLMNQDVYLEPDTISKIVKSHKLNPKYGILSPIHFNGSGSKLDMQFAKYISINKNIDLNDPLKESNQDIIYTVLYVNAAAWCLSKKSLMAVGGFDPLFFHYGEDENYCQRMLFHGFKIGVVDNTSIKHDREERVPLAKKMFSKHYFITYKKFIGVKFANINKDFSEQEFKKEYKKLVKKIIKGLIQFNFQDVIGYSKQLNLAKNTRKEILKSRENNRLNGDHYLT